MPNTSRLPAECQNIADLILSFDGAEDAGTYFR